MGRHLFAVAFISLGLLPAMPAAAAPAKAAAKDGASSSVSQQSPDAKFDKTGDGWVDAADWKRMTPKERAAYARACVRALGQDPDAGVGNGKSRADQYLEGLESVYGR